MDPFSIMMSGIMLYQLSCSNPIWEGTPGMNSNKRLEATISSVCKIQLEKSGSIASLEQNRLRSVTQDNQVHSGPISEFFESLHGVRYDVTAKWNQDGNNLVIRKDVHIASDQKSRLIHFEHSTQVDGEGDSSFLKEVDYREDFARDSARENAFQLKITQRTEIAKPWYAPESVFVSRAKKEILKSFAAQIQDDAALAARQLTD